MNDKRYQYTLYIIVAVIIATIGIQGYWNYKNYQSNKQQLIADVQTSLDKVVDDYYAQLAQKTTLGLRFEGNRQKDVFKEGGILENISKSIDKNNSTFKGLDSLQLNAIDGVTIIRGLKGDSLPLKTKENKFPFWKKDSTKKHQRLHIIEDDSMRIGKNFELLTSKVFISINNDTLDVKKVDSLLQLNLADKKINLDYSLNYNKPKQQFPDFFSSKENVKKQKTDSISVNPKLLNVASKSTFLPKGSTLSVHFENANWVAFKKGISAILISTLLVLAVISCLFFLLKIIKEQKQLAEVKNDLISNITHEFKTPIATIGVALESINNFNVIEDKQKTKQYIDMSTGQLSKLNVMVEKLLETATLDSESLKFNKEPLDVALLLDTLVNRYKTQHQDKNFKLSLDSESLMITADAFHFENAINNILDNAVKYGGEVISVDLKHSKNGIEINISDNGNSLKKENRQRIFEKFYRIPKGNTHDVKGYGIGLYYTKTIVNKHNGTIALDLSNNLTTFKINLLHG
ncbi:HAMP domain-containing histidine kinase [Hyunsoonleella flava]|uniref:histidine kinase n=1 Tax=Hyunsoonleella flava TaxID=2527939 RepID=A0A4Q9FEA9_9FLAO|nr:HAMP domain-containing sensor histidine kinase [Hyunsoonleella flava]TBN02349.1 HAMP domain-containing histidine kinase [Hyunsoonleella flava]